MQASEAEDRNVANFFRTSVRINPHRIVRVQSYTMIVVAHTTCVCSALQVDGIVLFVSPIVHPCCLHMAGDLFTVCGPFSLSHTCVCRALQVDGIVLVVSPIVHPCGLQKLAT